MSTEPSEGILAGVRILDMSWGLAGPVATQLLAEVGADVIKIEPPAGDPARASAGFATWNRSKRGAVLDLADQRGRDRLESLLASADVLVHGLRPAKAKGLGLDDASLAGRHPRLVTCSVLGYPIGHPDAERAGYDLLVQARSGLMDEQLGYRDGPIALRFPLPSWGAAYLAAAGIVTRLIVRERSGIGGSAHTSLLQGMLSTMSLVWNRAERPVPQLLSTKYDNPPQTAMYHCSDGVWLQIMNPGERIDIGALPLTKEVVAELGAPVGPVDADVLVTAFARRPSDTWLDALRAADVAVEPALPLGDLLRHPEVHANGLVVQVDDATWGPTVQAAAPFQVQPPACVQRRAPCLGEHDDEVFGGQPAISEGAGDARPASSVPLEGLRVLDVGAFLAGPFAPALLADLGADVIKVEPL
jgi:crotonobetainyl-CoA:carnitine CoA-transferase CaiB-like acyl-CoA transferase